jgi:hypothetical protein
MYKGKCILPSQVPTLGSSNNLPLRFKLAIRAKTRDYICDLSLKNSRDHTSTFEKWGYLTHN